MQTQILFQFPHPPEREIKFLLFSNHIRSLLRQQPRAIIPCSSLVCHCAWNCLHAQRHAKLIFFKEAGGQSWIIEIQPCRSSRHSRHFPMCICTTAARYALLLPLRLLQLLSSAVWVKWLLRQSAVKQSAYLHVA